jgi:voltage-gated potassium channel
MVDTPRPMVRRRRRTVANLRYLAALLARFRITLLSALALFLIAPPLYVWRYRTPQGERVGLGEALHHTYFLLFGEPSLGYYDDFLVELLNILIPPVGIAVVVDGIVRFAYLYFAKHRSDKEWIEVIARTMQGHIVICGAGRVGYRVATQLLALGQELVVIEKREEAAFVRVLQDQNVPVLIDDTRSPGCLPRTNVKDAVAIVCATDDDLANLNVALDARRLNPDIRVVIRLFDDDLVAKVRDTFKAEALSSSAVAAPAMALCALDPRIIHSFQVGRHLMVVSDFTAGRALSELTVSEVRDRFGLLTLALRKGEGPEQLHPKGATAIATGDVLTVQGDYTDYLRLRAFTGEERAPVSVAHGRTLMD